MTIQEVIERIPVKAVSGPTDGSVSGVVYDSRKGTEGSLFCALPGAANDGNEFVANAVDSGAAAIISEQGNPAQFPVAWLEVANARAAMGIAAANFEKHPSLEFSVVGITGTNGKTTTAFLVHFLFESILHRAGLIGTIFYSTGEGIEEAPHTTPESPEVHRLLREMRNHDCRGMAMEVSSHGLVQHRVEGVAFDVGIFTNLSQDHLDFHGNMEDYFAAKKRLFDQMESEDRKTGVALVNIDDAFGARLAKAAFERIEVKTYGRAANADYRASDLHSDFDGTRFKLSVGERSFLVRIPLIGSFNVANSVAAIAAAHSAGLNLRETIAKMAEAPQVPGRLEAVGGRQINYRVFVDYAHTPDALVNVIETLRALEPVRLITVFGCGGDRDVTKRAPMAAAVEKGSNLSILTSDNPRTESPTKILADAEKGFRGNEYEVIEDRAEAIRRAIELAGERDIVLIAGKGHEAYQEIEGVRHDFDDRKVSAKWIAEKSERGSR
ncbi:MAG: UDP-N-acetylmuramoyl-L-alanyl-D-glutamate--2,6-diaminopimelate ligase [Verrucomicrobiota bacterium]